MIRSYLEQAVAKVKTLEGKLGKNAEYAVAEKLNKLMPEGYEATVTVGSKSADIIVKNNGVFVAYIEVKARTSFHRRIEWGAVSNKRGFIGRSLYDPKQKKYRELYFVYLHVEGNKVTKRFVRSFDEVKFYRSGGHGQVKNVSMEFFNGDTYDADGFKFDFTEAVAMLRTAANLRVA